MHRAEHRRLVTDLLAAGDIDVSFMPVDEERKKRIDFGPYYCMIESTYMVTGPSGLKTLAEVDQPHVRVVGIANTTTIRASARSLKNTQPIAATSINDAMAMLHSGKADAYAMGRDSLPEVDQGLPGARIVDGGFQQTGIAIAVPKGGRRRWLMLPRLWSERRSPAWSARRWIAQGCRRWSSALAGLGAEIGEERGSLREHRD